MSFRSILFLAAAAALAFAPAATAQGYTVAIEIQDLPATVESNGTSVLVPFSVHATVSGAQPCVTTTGGSQYVILLDAEVVDSTGNSTVARVNPKQVTIAGPVLLSAAGQGERTEEAALTISPGPYSGDLLNATVKVTATFEGGNPGCTGAGNTAASSAEGTVKATFLPVPSLYGGDEPTAELPAPGAVLLMVALGAVVLVLRRRA